MREEASLAPWFLTGQLIEFQVLREEQGRGALRVLVTFSDIDQKLGHWAETCLNLKALCKGLCSRWMGKPESWDISHVRDIRAPQGGVTREDPLTLLHVVTPLLIPRPPGSVCYSVKVKEIN